MAEAEETRMAIGLIKRIVELINKFEADLPDDYMAGGHMASFHGKEFAIDDVGYCEPNIIIFHGTLESGEKVQLLQHASQLNLLLRAVRRRDMSTPRRIRGFSLPEVPEEK